MGLLTVHSTPLLKEYQSTAISRATLFTCVCFAIIVVGPLLIAYGSHGFWSKHRIERQVPRVRFEHRLLLVVHHQSNGPLMTWSTFPEYNALMSPFLRRPTISSVEHDENKDGIYDRLELNLELETTKNETIHSVQLILIFSYALTEISDVNMETMAVVQYNSGMPLSKVHYAGDLSWVQKKVLQFRQPDNRYNKTVISNRYEISDIVENYHSREYMTELKNGYYTPQFGSGTRLRIAANIRYAEAVVEYAPGFWNVIKWAWIQYASILVIFFYVIETVKNFAFSNRLVPTWNEKTIQYIRQ